MSGRVHAEAQAAPKSSYTHVRTGLLQRSSADHAGPATVPPIVHEVLRSSGQPLDPETLAYMEPRFGHDFSKVRVHTDTKAAESAESVNALAYTVGRDVVFGAKRYALRMSGGRELLAHELTHVVQHSGTPNLSSTDQLTLDLPNSIAEREAKRKEAEVIAGGSDAAGTLSVKAHLSASSPSERDSAGPQLMRETNPTVDAVKMPRQLDYKRIADHIHEAIAGLGTDEEAVYRALQELDRNQAAIDELKKVYLEEHKVPLLDDIYDDFSDTELDYALQLINMGASGSKQRIEPAPASTMDVTLAATRIREAVEVMMGTDEEAIFAVLLPFKQNTLAIQNEYYRRYHEDLRDRLVDELSGSELDYALELLETPYEHYIHEANEKLAGMSFGSFGDIQAWCFPEMKETSAGTKYIYWYDTDYWEPDVDQQQGMGICKVKLLPGKSPTEAIDAMFDHQNRWRIACAEFIQIVHLYALRHTLGGKRFDQRVGKGGVTLEIKRRESTGIKTKVTFSRKGPSEQMVRSDTRQFDKLRLDEILAAAPIGSRVRWTNLVGANPEEGNPWEHENTIKLGPNKFGAHGTATGIFSTSNTHTREEVELLTARGTNPKADTSYVNANIFISQIEIFRNPSQL